MIVYEIVWLSAVSLVLALVVHEGGHIVGALAVGIVPRVLVLGVGPVVLRLRRGAFVIVLRAVPLTGYVLSEPSGRVRAYAALVAGGPLANLLALAACRWASAVWPDAVTPGALAIAQGVFAARTLFPSRGKVAGLFIPSDGLQLYYMFRARTVPSLAASFAPHAAPMLPSGAPPPAPTRHTARLLFALHRADQLADGWARAEAFASLRALLSEPDLTIVERGVVLCNLCAYQFLFDEGLGTAPDADAWSLEALELTGEPMARDTRGAVLLLSGRRDEAERLIRSALDGYGARGEAESLGAVLCLALLARAVGAAGRADEAGVLRRQVEAAPVIAASPQLRNTVTRIMARALPPRPVPDSAAAGADPAPSSRAPAPSLPPV